ncbi:hypothetical protein ACN38_g11608 [Penicillium nordicum]|uniref:Uncharacterized protein n=1 Tax=Penicillium nordicum TaxID=229535 RepID=A0A0M9WAK5_9EURO|nr:hypothetical protein ACN38_g11608 [Penicillium nordicum]
MKGAGGGGESKLAASGRDICSFSSKSTPYNNLPKEPIFTVNIKLEIYTSYLTYVQVYSFPQSPPEFKLQPPLPTPTLLST